MVLDTTRLSFQFLIEILKNEIGQILPQTEVVRLDPSVSVYLDNTSVQTAASLEWVSLKEHEVDYEYKKDLKPPATSEISKKFPPFKRSSEGRANKVL